MPVRIAESKQFVTKKEKRKIELYRTCRNFQKTDYKYLSPHICTKSKECNWERHMMTFRTCWRTGCSGFSKEAFKRLDQYYSDINTYAICARSTIVVDRDPVLGTYYINFEDCYINNHYSEIRINNEDVDIYDIRVLIDRYNKLCINLKTNHTFDENGQLVSFQFNDEEAEEEYREKEQNSSSTSPAVPPNVAQLLGMMDIRDEAVRQSLLGGVRHSMGMTISPENCSLGARMAIEENRKKNDEEKIAELAEKIGEKVSEGSEESNNKWGID